LRLFGSKGLTNRAIRGIIEEKKIKGDNFLTKTRAQKAPVPVRKMLKEEIIWLFEHKCKHGHTYAEHYACFLKEKPKDSPFIEKQAIFDIETTGLKANWSHMLCWCFLNTDTGIVTCDLISKKEARDKNDKRIIKSCVKELKKFDRTFGWYSSRFDIPYIRSRAEYHGIPFPTFKEALHTDLYYIARQRLALHSNRLQAVCQFFGIKAKNHPMTPQLWTRAGAGEKAALEEVLTHCKEDVVSTEAARKLLTKYSGAQKKSL